MVVVFIVVGVIFFLIWRWWKGEVLFNFRGFFDFWFCVGVLFYHCIMLFSRWDDCFCCKLFIFYFYLDRCKLLCLNFDIYSYLLNIYICLMKCELLKFIKDIIFGEVIIVGVIRWYGVLFCCCLELDVCWMMNRFVFWYKLLVLYEGNKMFRNVRSFLLWSMYIV